MLLNPFEKGFYAPSQTVYVRYFFCRKVETVYYSIFNNLRGKYIRVKKILF